MSELAHDPRHDAAAAEARFLERLRRRVAWQAQAAARLRGAVARAEREDGQVLPLLVVGLLTVLLGISALVVDVGHAYVVERKLQAVADAAALAAAGALPDAASAAGAAVAFGPSGKNAVAGVDVAQTVTPFCLRSLAYCYGNEPGSTPADGRANGVVVTERTSVPTTFGRLFGLDSIDVRARATACGLCGAVPLDIALVVDRTGSMSDNMDDLRAGVRTFLQTLDPQLDYVSLLVLPPLWLGGACAPPLAWSSLPLTFGASYPTWSDDRYVAVGLSNDYKSADGSLNENSQLVQAVDCLRAGGSTSYEQALVAAQRQLVQSGSGREGVQRVIVFESDGAANEAPDSAYDPSKATARLGHADVYQPADGRQDDVLRPCGAAVDYANGTVKPSGTLVFTVAYAVDRDDTCYQAPHAEQGWRSLTAVGYQDRAEGLSASSALAQIASPGDAVSQGREGDLSQSFAQIANKLLGAKLVPDGEGP